ncbi:MAG: PIN domain nuclease, partial [Pseudonocardiales bacterium]|nr:PIN domain nuclease [Pseudonocardiales bacterium]
MLLDEAERAGMSIAVPVGPLAQVWRGGPRQTNLARFINSAALVTIVEWDTPSAMAVGVLCGRTGVADVVDASVVLVARERNHAVVTSDPQELAALDPLLPLVVV